MPDSPQDVEKWKGQFRKGFLELCVVVSFESNGRQCGVDVMERLKRAGISLSEGTLYPLLARLAQEDTLVSEWETPETGHPRKYYGLSPEGRERAARQEEEFEASYLSFRELKGEKS